MSSTVHVDQAQKKNIVNCISIWRILLRTLIKRFEFHPCSRTGCKPEKIEDDKKKGEEMRRAAMEWIRSKSLLLLRL